MDEHPAHGRGRRNHNKFADWSDLDESRHCIFRFEFYNMDRYSVRDGESQQQYHDFSKRYDLDESNGGCQRQLVRRCDLDWESVRDRWKQQQHHHDFSRWGDLDCTEFGDIEQFDIGRMDRQPVGCCRDFGRHTDFSGWRDLDNAGFGFRRFEIHFMDRQSTGGRWF